jgi:hypothetical protein
MASRRHYYLPRRIEVKRPTETFNRIETLTMMSITACSLLVAALASGSVGTPAVSPTLIAIPVAATGTSTAEQAPTAPAAPAAWTLDRPVNRPAALPVMYVMLGGMQAFDIYSTRRAITSGGGQEVNPLLKQAAGNSGTMLAVKAASTAATIYFAEKMWKKNRKGAMILLAVVNGATAAVAVRNMRNAR